MNTDEVYGAVLTSVRAHVGCGYAVAIPSYRRAGRIGACTLATLDRLRLDRDRVTVFVADEAEADEYRAALDDAWRVVVACHGQGACRQWYSNNYYPAGTRLLNLDDDLDALLARAGTRAALWEGTIDDIAAIGFGMSAALGTTLWGTSGFTNALYMHDEAIAGLRFIISVLYGSYAGDQVCAPSDLVVDPAGDSFRVLRAYAAYGSVVRLDWLGPKTTYYAEGGLNGHYGGSEARERAKASQMRRLALQYPQWTRLLTDKGGITQLKVKSMTMLRVPRASLENALIGG